MRAARVCPTPDCPEFMPCTQHARPNAHQRGYTRQHKNQRTAWAPRVAAGQVQCWRCGQPIAPTEAWDLGHDDGDRSITRGPEHAGRCNRSAAGRASHDRH